MQDSGLTPRLLKRFESNVRLFRVSRRQKVTRALLKILKTSVLGLAARYFEKGIKAKTRILTGDKMMVVLPEEVSTALYQYGFYEEGLTRMLIQLVRPGMIFST